jgi:hypothetical protein
MKWRRGELRALEKVLGYLTLELEREMGLTDSEVNMTDAMYNDLDDWFGEEE